MPPEPRLVSPNSSFLSPPHLLYAHDPLLSFSKTHIIIAELYCQPRCLNPLLLTVMCQHQEDSVLHLLEPLPQLLGRAGPAHPALSPPAPPPARARPLLSSVLAPILTCPPHLPQLHSAPSPQGSSFPLSFYYLISLPAGPQGPLLPDQTNQVKPPSRQGATTASTGTLHRPQPGLPGSLAGLKAEPLACTLCWKQHRCPSAPV